MMKIWQLKLNIENYLTNADGCDLSHIKYYSDVDF